MKTTLSHAFQKTWSIIFLILWMSLIFYLSNRPGLTTGLPQDFVIRKIAHVFEYAVLAWLAFRAVRLNLNYKTFANKKRAALAATFVFCMMYAASDEFHQTFVPHREGKLHDVAIDSIGIVGALILIHAAPKIASYLSSLSSAKGKK